MNSIIRKAVIFVAVMAVVACAGWFGRKAYKRATERRLLAQARVWIEKKDYRNAALELQRARQVNPMSLEASRLTADMLETVGLPAALSWRIRTAQLDTNNMELRLAWAQTALRMSEPLMALQALRGVEGSARAAAPFHKLAGAVAWSMRDPQTAEKEYLEALRLEATNEVVKLDLATIRLASTNPAVAAAARQSLEQVPASSPLRATAVRYLTADLAEHKDLAQAISRHEELLNGPGALYSDKILHLRLLRAAQRPEYGTMLAGLKEDATRAPEHAFQLGRWLFGAEGPTNTLHWLGSLPRPVQTNQPVPLLITDCQIALRDWKAILALVRKEQWGETEFYRCALEAYAQRSLGQDVAAKAAWQKGFSQAASRLDRLARLNQVTAAWKLNPERAEVLREVISRFPRERWAADQLIAMLYEARDSKGLAALLGRVYASNPSDPKLKQSYAAFSLLRNSNLEEAHRLALEAYKSLPTEPAVLCTYAYSLLLQHKADEAVKVISELKPEALKVPTFALYYGAIQAQTGHKDAAKGPLGMVASARLLPEEEEIARQARARLKAGGRLVPAPCA